MSKPGAQNKLCVFHIGGRDSTAFRCYHQLQPRVCIRRKLDPKHSDLRSRLPNGCLNQCTKTALGCTSYPSFCILSPHGNYHCPMSYHKFVFWLLHLSL